MTLAILLALQGGANFNSPAIDGVLFKPAAFSALKFNQASGKAEGDGIRVVFQGGTDYPNVQFPCPAGGWNLSAFGGVQVDLKNVGATDVTAAIRVDNAGDWHQSPWNTATVRLAAGKAGNLRVLFGEGGYKLDSSHVTGIQVFLLQPKQEASLLISNLRAFGSAKDQIKSGSFSTLEDAKKPVIPAKWVGKRPPVPGDWVKTLSEEFDGSKVNEKLWSDKTWWNGLLAEQTQAYSKTAVDVKNGLLTMKFEKKTVHEYDDPALPSRDYSTGLLITFDKWSQLYGYFEARIKLPTARGLWPAFWMMPDRGRAAGPEGWKREDTRNGGMEFDILEHLTEWGPGRYNVAAHWDGYEADHKSWGNGNVYFGPTPDGWHNFGLLWEPGKLTWYCDGIKKAEFENSRVGSVPGYLILNIQSGGWATRDMDVAKLPDQMQVDYIRAWQLRSRLKAK